MDETVAFEIEMGLRPDFTALEKKLIAENDELKRELLQLAEKNNAGQRKQVEDLKSFATNLHKELARLIAESALPTAKKEQLMQKVAALSKSKLEAGVLDVFSYLEIKQCLQLESQMTIVAGFFLNTTPCCGATYATRRYKSMNFLAFEYWTDGYRKGSLMSNDRGLRKCKCGTYYLRSELQCIAQVDETDVELANTVPKHELPLVIASAKNLRMELLARLDYWQELNHAYREQYRSHRDAEDAATKALWEQSNPDNRSWWQKLKGIKPPVYFLTNDRPFTFPPFKPTAEQCSNMQALIQLINVDQFVDDYRIELAELHRELGSFDDATSILKAISENDLTSTGRQIMHMASKLESAPIRFQM